MPKNTGQPPRQTPSRRSGLLRRHTSYPARATRQVVALLALSLASHTGPTAALPPSPPGATQHAYLQRAQEYRQAGNLRQEQFELTKALRAWPTSTALHHAYALHLVRRKNLSEALVHTAQSLAIDGDQPATANLHLRLLAGLDRSAESVSWVTELLRLHKAQPPLELWASDWLKRWQEVLVLGRRYAATNNNLRAIALIDGALNLPAPKANSGKQLAQEANGN